MTVMETRLGDAFLVGARGCAVEEKKRTQRETVREEWTGWHEGD